jgi:hypothetical protein
MASGHKKRKAGAVGISLQSAGLTNYLPVDRSNTLNTGKVTSNSLFSSGTTGASFIEGSTTILSNNVSNTDGNWTLMGYAGESAANAAGFLKTNTVHRYLVYPGVPSVTYTDTTPVVIYSKDGPQGFFNPAYLPTGAQADGTGSIQWLATNITQSAGSQSYLRVWIAGSVPTGSTGATVRVTYGFPPTGSLLIFSASSTPTMISASVATTALTTAGFLRVQYSSSASTYNQNSFNSGILVYISGSDA